jgi:ATP-dependent 26S proteasome regulatory subunit
MRRSAVPAVVPANNGHLPHDLVNSLFLVATEENTRQFFDYYSAAPYEVGDGMVVALTAKLKELHAAPSVLDVNAAVIEPEYEMWGQRMVWVQSRSFGHALLMVAPQFDGDVRTGDRVAIRQTESGPQIVARIGPFEGKEIRTFDQRLDDRLAIVSGAGSQKQVYHLVDALQRDGKDLKPGIEVYCATEPGLITGVRDKTQELSVGRLIPVRDLGLEDLGGQPEARRALRRLLMLMQASPELLAALGLTACRLVLFEGGPGTGKSWALEVLAGELQRAGMNPALLYLNATEVRDKWVGETERKIRELKAEAIRLTQTFNPVILGIDEFDSMTMSRSAFNFGSEVGLMATDTILGEFGALGAQDELNHVITIGLSNMSSTMIDPAVMREGRFSYSVKFTSLAAEQDVFEIAAIHLRDRLLAAGLQTEVAAERLATYAFNGHSGNGIALASVRMARGPQVVITTRDVLTGAMVAGAVGRAAENALCRTLSGGAPGITLADLYTGLDGAVRDLGRKLSRQSLDQYLASSWPPDRMSNVLEVIPIDMAAAS